MTLVGVVAAHFILFLVCHLVLFSWYQAVSLPPQSRKEGFGAALEDVDDEDIVEGV